MSITFFYLSLNSGIYIDKDVEFLLPWPKRFSRDQGAILRPARKQVAGTLRGPWRPPGPKGVFRQSRNWPRGLGIQFRLSGFGFFGDDRRHRLLDLVKGPHLKLADPLAADAVFLAKLLQRLRIVLQPPLGENMAFAFR